MSDYIKRDDAIKAVANNYWHGTDCECYAFAHKALDGIQSADVVQVIRCKDCKHWQPSEYGVVEQPYCKHLGYKEETGLDIRIGNENDFCSFGERRDDE